MAEDIPIADDAGNYAATNVEDALAEVSESAAGGLNFIDHNQALGFSPASVAVPAGEAPNRLLISIYLQADFDGRIETTLVKNGVPVVFPGTAKTMIVKVDNGGSGLSGLTATFLLRTSLGEYDPDVINTFTTTGASRSNGLTTITIFGS